MLKFYFILLLISVINCPNCFSQGNPDNFAAVFAWQVKQLDEFIERFDDNDSTLIKEYNRKYGQKNLTRAKFIISLFNAEDRTWNLKEIKRFISEVDNKQNPVFLDFFDDNWYAVLNCSVTWKGKPQNIELTMKIQKLPDGSSKWMICGASAGFLKIQRVTDSSTYSGLRLIPPARSPDKTFLHPYSHATGFININQVSKDKINIANYIAIPVGSHDELLTFVNEVIKNHLVIKRTTSVNYVFKQVKGWVFEVREYNRQTTNSGWLISKLTRTSPI